MIKTAAAMSTIASVAPGAMAVSGVMKNLAKSIYSRVIFSGKSGEVTFALSAPSQEGKTDGAP